MLDKIEEKENGLSAEDILRDAQPIGVLSNVHDGMDSLEQVANTPLGRDTEQEDPGIVVRLLGQCEIDSLEYAQKAQALYNAAGRPRYEGDLNRERIAQWSQWKEFLRAGNDLAATYLSLKKAKDRELSPREEELAKRLQLNTSVQITLPHLEERYPADLITLAQKSLSLKRQASESSNADKLEYLSVKLTVEVEYLQFLMEE